MTARERENERGRAANDREKAYPEATVLVSKPSGGMNAEGKALRRELFFPRSATRVSASVFVLLYW